MQAKKFILKTDRNGFLIEQPQLPPNTSMEVIFLIQHNPKSIKAEKKPSAKIFRKGKITGDIVSSVVPPEDWNALQ
ncbi:hypothetical protein [Desulfotignum balticum]|uniref:hypothetical protein n=1 Tax=Desulfotignum balticum TaxID=115781 RepID=UPI0004628300|nr:hypothetical protein [Desulfotignum balticum]